LDTFMLWWNWVEKGVAPLSVALALSLSTCSEPKPKAYPTESAAQSAQNSRSPPAALASGWPMEFQIEDKKVSIYPPQVENWSGDRIKERAVVSVETKASSKPIFGTVSIAAKTNVNPKSRRVSFEQIRWSQARFPTAPELSALSIKALKQHQDDILKPVSLESLQSSLAITRVESQVKGVSLRNGPPKIVTTRTPLFLVQVDGAPVLRDSGVPNIMRVINTRALLLFDSSKGRYFIYMGDRWMDALTLRGPWIESDQPPAGLEEAKKIAVDQKQVDLLNDPSSPLMKQIAKKNVPQPYISTEPTEILETEGKPEFQSISGTRLLFVSNTESNIFLDTNDKKEQSYYVLLSGRWYRAKSLEGPWRYVPADTLPREFAKIPETHRKGAVLAAVPGTREASEAKVNNQVPTTAKINRNQAGLEIQYDGPPQFEPVEETSMKYAVNSRTPVIQVEPNQYYALQSGVWFRSSSPDGPWAVATRVPAVIYTIPPSSPLYYVTYVRVYDSTPDSVIVGYTPGYLGTYCCSDGVVVYGTGYYYPPWVGTYWIGPPVTFGVGFTWGYSGAFFVGPVVYPWWGPWWGGPVYVGYPYVVTGAVPVGQGTVYQGWSTGVTTVQNPAPFQSAYVGSGGTWQSGQSGQMAGTANSTAAPPNPNSWQASQPGSPPPNVSVWNPPPPPPPASEPQSAPWGMGPPPGASVPVAPPPSVMSAPVGPSSGGGTAGAISQGFQGGGWSGHK
jgi:hypothetical protein